MRLRAAYRRDLAAQFRSHPAVTQPLTAADVRALPPQVQRYLRFADAIDAPRVWNYRLRFGGEFQMRFGGPWTRITAEQQSFADPPARLFLMKASRMGIPFVAYHRYVGAQATFQVRLASLIKVVDARGPQMTQGETVTLLNDMCLLAPATLIDPRLSWEELDERSVRVRFTNAGHTISAVLLFAPAGELVDFASDDRYATTDGKTYKRMRWSTPVRAWGSVDGLMLPVRAEAAWGDEGAEAAYARFDILEAEYNVRPPLA